jgi:hypothetical protein
MMPNRSVAYCGFAEIELHLKCKTAEDTSKYNSRVGYHMKIDGEEWMKQRKRLTETIKGR